MSGPGTGLSVRVREERPEDVEVIRQVNEEAFEQPDEARIVGRLREQGAVLLSLVAVAGERIVGHVLYSPVRLESDAGSLDGAGLGPMAVRPVAQRRGVGSALIAEGTRRLRERGCPFVVVLGHPQYYPRFGFVPARRHGVRCTWDVPDEAFMLLPLDVTRLRGRSGVARYREEFGAVA